MAFSFQQTGQSVQQEHGLDVQHSFGNFSIFVLFVWMWKGVVYFVPGDAIFGTSRCNMADRMEPIQFYYKEYHKGLKTWTAKECKYMA